MGGALANGTGMNRNAPPVARGAPPLERARSLARAQRLGWARLRLELGPKVGVLLGLTVGICVPYFLLQRGTLFPLRTLPRTGLDAWIGFDPVWVWVYATIAVLVPLLPLQATSREELVRYAKGLALLCAACFAIFLLFPVEGPRPLAPPDQASYRALISVDSPTNSMPSLHAALTLYSFLFGHRVLRNVLGSAGRAAYALGAVAWTGAILYSTLALKQHWALDLPPGLALAWLAHRWAWRDADPAAAQAASPEVPPRDRST